MESEFQYSVNEDSQNDQTIGLSNTAIGYLSAAFALSRMRHLFMPVVLIFAVYKIGVFTEVCAEGAGHADREGCHGWPAHQRVRALPAYGTHPQSVPPPRQEALYAHGLNTMSWIGEKLTGVMTAVYDVEQWLFLRVGAIFTIIMA